MKVYRIEHRDDADGPYRSYGTTKQRRELANSMKDAHTWGDMEHPGPSEDGLWPVRGWDYFGFTHRRLLVKWFREFLPELKRCGYVQAVYEVPKRDVAVGTTGLQVKFPLVSAKRLYVRELPG